MKDYSTGKIYAIRSAQTDEIYIGSTIQPLCVRMAGHRSGYKKYISGKGHNVTSYKILQFDDAYIELLEAYPCTCKEELMKREGQSMREHKNCINKCIAGRSDKEYHQDNKEKIATHKQEYYQANRDEFLAKAKKYQQDNLDKVKNYKHSYYQDNKDELSFQHQQYYQDNKDTLLAYHQQYYQDNKDKIQKYRQDNKDKISAQQKQYRLDNKDKQSAKFECKCGGRYIHRKKTEHETTLKHQQYISLHTETE